MPDMAYMPEELSRLILSMLDASPVKRPSAEEIIIRLNEMTKKEPPSEELSGTVVESKSETSSWFVTAGDL